MANSLRIAIIVHDCDDFENDGYLLARLCVEWRKIGANVEVVRPLDGHRPEADLAILHANMTCVSKPYLDLSASYPVTVNARAVDISKRTVSNMLLDGPDQYEGPVIVKTNNNFGGKPERKHLVAAGELDPKHETPKTWRDMRWMGKYPLFSSPNKVPRDVWENPALVVERLVPERNAQGQYVLRVWAFLGDHSTHFACISRELVIKSTNTLRRDQLDVDTVPEVLKRRRAELGFDYGKFDYVMVNGEAVLLDANKTPGLAGRGAEDAENAARLKYLSEGIEAFMSRARERAQ